MAQYVGILEGSDDVGSIRVPDLPGCHGGGASADDAVADTISAMREWAAAMTNDGYAVPQPRDLNAVMQDSGAEFNPVGGETLVMLPLLLDKARSVKANISLDAGLLEQIDVEAKRRGITRSAFLVSAARDKIMAGTVGWVEAYAEAQHRRA